MPLIADKNYFADAGGSLVEEGSAKASILVARAGTAVDQKTVKRYGLKLEEGAPERRFRGRDVASMKASESNEDLARRGIKADDETRQEAREAAAAPTTSDERQTGAGETGAHRDAKAAPGTTPTATTSATKKSTKK